MTFEEFLRKLNEMKSELLDTVTNEKIRDLEQSLAYYKNETKRQELENVTLRTRMAEIRNFLNGCYDKTIA